MLPILELDASPPQAETLQSQIKECVLLALNTVGNLLSFCQLEVTVLYITRITFGSLYSQMRTTIPIILNGYF